MDNLDILNLLTRTISKTSSIEYITRIISFKKAKPFTILHEHAKIALKSNG